VLVSGLYKRKLLWSKNYGGAYFSIKRNRFIKCEIKRGTLFVYYLTPGVYLLFQVFSSGSKSRVSVSFRKIFPGKSQSRVFNFIEEEGDEAVFEYSSAEALPNVVLRDFAGWGYPPDPVFSPYSAEDVAELISLVRQRVFWSEGSVPVE